MHDPRTSLEFRLLKQADKIRMVLVGLFLLLAYTVPSEQMRSATIASLVVGFLALYAIFSRFILNWKIVRREGQVKLMAGFLACADLVFIGGFLWAAGPRFSSLSTLMLVDVVFVASFFAGIEIVCVVGIVCISYYLLAVPGGGPYATLQVIGSSGATIVVGWFAHVLSEVRRQEAAVTDRIVRNLTEGVILLAADGRVSLVNPRAEQVLGIRAMDVLGCEVKDLDGGETHAPMVHLLTAILMHPDAGPPNIEVGAHDVHVEDPQPMDLQVLTVPCLGEHGTVAGWVIVFRDITALVGDVRAKEEGLMAASHELRGRVHSVRAATEILTQMAGELSPEMRLEALRLLDGETSRLSRLIARILDAASIESGALQLKTEEVHLDAVAGDVCASLGVMAAEKRITLELDAPQGLPPVMGDRVRLDQVVQNLVENAIKFTPEGGLVRVSVAASEGDVAVAVSDTGQGIPADRQNAIFRKFVRDEAHARISRSAGLGLGLYISGEIVRLHNGQIGVASAEGHGSTFTVSIPVSGADPVPGDTAEGIPGTGRPAGAN